MTTYILLRPVNRNLALISAFFGIASMVTFASAESSYYAASLVVRDAAGMGAFTAEQRNALALLALRISATIAGLFLALYGIATMIRGYLIMRSGYFPAVFGVAGAGFFIHTATFLRADIQQGLSAFPDGGGGDSLHALAADTRRPHRSCCWTAVGSYHMMVTR